MDICQKLRRSAESIDQKQYPAIDIQTIAGSDYVFLSETQPTQIQLNNLCIKYPKSEKLALASETKQAMYLGLRHLMYAFKEFNKKNKLEHLNDLDVELNLQKVFVRLAYKYQYISKQNYETWCTKITDICNMLGGWIKSCLAR